MLDKLSLPNSSVPTACLAVNAHSPNMNWIIRILLQSLSSLSGPNQTSNKLIIVIFEQLTILLSLSNSKSMRCRTCNNLSTGTKKPFGGFSFKSALDGYSRPSLSLNLGSLCLGQKTMLNNCGHEYRKLTICGRNNSNMVFEKCPSIPTTANTIPAK